MALTRWVVVLYFGYLHLILELDMQIEVILKPNSFLLQAIELSAESLANVKFIQEKKLIGKYFDEISQDTGKYCFGVDDTLKALEMGAVETLICWENLDIQVISF